MTPEELKAAKTFADYGNYAPGERTRAVHSLCRTLDTVIAEVERLQAELTALREAVRLKQGAIEAQIKRDNEAGVRVDIIGGCETSSDMADEIEQLRAENAALRADLERAGDRIAIQKDLLEKRAEGWPTPIPCAERMPELGEKVLLLSTYRDWCIGWRRTDSDRYAWEDIAEFVYKEAEVMAWLPLPPTGGVT